MTYTKRQHELLKFIVEYQRTHEGLSPTLGEMAGVMGVSKVTIFEHLQALKEKGAIDTERRKSRSVRVLDTEFGQTPGTLRLLGSIAAGRPIEALESPEPFEIDSLVDQTHPHYVLRVKGESMRDDGIRDGDFVIVRQTAVARNGDTVVAVIGDNEATLKRYFHEGDRVRLQPANETLAPVYVDRCEIRGVVEGVFRRY